ncbi:MAG: phosphoribosylanthranilate isomerase [Lachnospiraceae bacterium]|jgi:phosphoribosylanthranilate isomerase|nr:phosphoribosylanthranilate isomerase [Lachnospiraceae bacterium]
MKIKICGITTMQEVLYINNAHPDYVGFVFAESRRQVDERTAAELRGSLHNDIIPVGVFRDNDGALIDSLVTNGIIAAIQLHGNEPPELVAKQKAKYDITVIKAISVGDSAQEALIPAYEAAGADFFLFDHGSGGSGQIFDWGKLPSCRIPYFVAGGLNAGNIMAAIAATKPYAVDISSGVEGADGKKDREKITEIMRIVKK